MIISKVLLVGLVLIGASGARRRELGSRHQIARGLRDSHSVSASRKFHTGSKDTKSSNQRSSAKKNQGPISRDAGHFSNLNTVTAKRPLSRLQGRSGQDRERKTRGQHQKSGRPRRRPARKQRQVVDPVKAGVDFSLAVFDPSVGKMCVTKEEEVASVERQKVLECIHKQVEKCHYTYVTQFQPTQEEVCDENFEKSCQITFKQQAYNETVRKCYRPVTKVCKGEGPEECRTVYESSCTTKYVEKQPGKFVGDTGCEKLPVEICGAGCTFEEGEEECHDKVITSVVDVPEEVCDLNPQKTCRFVTKLVPRLKPTHQCTIVPQEVCQLKFNSPQQVKKPLLTKWCLDETPPQAGELYPGEEEERSSGPNVGGLGPVLLEEDFSDFERVEKESFHENAIPTVNNHPTKLSVELEEPLRTGSLVPSSPGSRGNIDFGDGFVLDAGDVEVSKIVINEDEDEDEDEESTEQPLLDLQLGVPDEDFDLPQVTFEVPKVNTEVSSEQLAVEDTFENGQETFEQDEDSANVTVDNLDYEEEENVLEDDLAVNVDEEEFVTFVDDSFPSENFDNYEEF